MAVGFSGVETFQEVEQLTRHLMLLRGGGRRYIAAASYQAWYGRHRQKYNGIGGIGARRGRQSRCAWRAD